MLSFQVSITLRASEVAVQCVVVAPVCLCLFVCLWVCYHDNSKLRASILTKLGLQIKVVTVSSLLNFGRPAPPGRGLRRGENFRLRHITASAQCLHLSGRFMLRVVRVGSIQGPRGGVLSCNAGVRGLAVLDDRLYVLQVGRSVTDIAVHDTSLQSAKRLSPACRRLTIPSLRDASDLAACGRHRCLYVADVGDDCVHRLHGLHGTLSFESWPVGDKPWGLSVTSVCDNGYFL